MVTKQLLYGSTLEDNRIPNPAGETVVRLPGQHKHSPAAIPLDQDTLSKHSLLIGGTGCGKTNLFYYMFDQVLKKLTKDDVVIVFDSKGDFISRFYQPGHLVIGNSPKYYQQSERWNLFLELVADGWDKERYTMNAKEICRILFKERKRTTTNTFFPISAADILCALLCSMLRAADEDVPARGQSPIARENFFNDKLVEYMNTHDAADIVESLSVYDENRSVVAYIDGYTDQSQGVISELYSLIREVFVGVFADHGMFSIRNFVRQGGGKVLYIEYDLALGSVLGPIYSLIIDLALKEALGQSASKGNLYLFCDEFKLIPRLEHIDDGVNVGRSMGVKIFAGLQSIEQLYEVYQNERGRNIAAGFSSVYAFRANDSSTRNFVKELFGRNIVLERYKTLDNRYVEEKRNGYTVEDWDLLDLQVGEAVVGLPFQKPFRFQFDRYT